MTVALGAGVLRVIPGPPPGAAVTPSAAPAQVHTVAAFRRIVLPDLAVIEPAGVSSAEVSRIAKTPGVRQVLALDGARLTMNGHRVSVLGVDAQQFRSWTPLSTASNQQLWNTLASGGFVASAKAQHRLGLHQGTSYPVTGASTVSLRYAGSAPLGIGGIDMVVGAQVSAKLGLIHHVAVLISAPGVRMGKLQREVGAAAGGKATLVALRAQSPASAPLSTAPGKQPTTYVQLFQESAAMFCPGLPWTVLAAIGQIESGDRANPGVSTAGALGPMQFLPSTWARWGITATMFGQTGRPDIMNPFDAVPSAARYLCAAGGATAAGLPKAVFAYNHAVWYVNEVLALAQQYARAYS